MLSVEGKQHATAWQVDRSFCLLNVDVRQAAAPLFCFVAVVFRDPASCWRLYRASIDSKVLQPRVCLVHSFTHVHVLVHRHNIYLTIFYCLKSNLRGPSFATFVGQYRLFMCCTCELFEHNQPITLLFILLLTSSTFQCSATNWRHVSSCLDLPPQP